MARYSTFKYGTARKYGTSPTTTNLLWTFMVDWPGNGTWTNEGPRMSDFNLQRGRDNWLSKDGFDQYRPGVVTAVFDNDDRRFDPWNTSSPIYPYVLPGKFVRCRVKNGNTGSDYNLMWGTISDVQVFNQGKRRFARIVVKDAMEWLNGVQIRLENKESFTFGELIENVLDAAGVPSEWSYTSNHNGNVIPFCWFSDISALSAIGQLEKAELGTLRHLRTGSIVWSARTAAPTDTTVITEAQILRDFSIKQPWETVVNNAVVQVNPLASHNITDDIWVMEQVPVALPPGVTLTYNVTFKHPTLNIPIVGDNIEDLFSGLTLNDPSEGVYLAMTLSDISDTAVLTFLYSGTVINMFINAFSIIGDAIYAQYPLSIESNDIASQAAYGTKTVTLSSPMMQRESIAQIQADGLIDNLAAPIPAPIITIENRPTLQFPFDLYANAINLQLPSIGLDETYRIGRIEHSWKNETGQAVVTTFNLEPILSW